MKKTIVLAGSYKQFITYCHEKNINPHSNDFIYVHSLHQIQGIRDFKILKIGTWYENRAYGYDFMMALKAREAIL